MCVPGQRGTTAIGQHASIEDVPNSSEIRLTINIPFEVASMADFELNIKPELVLIRKTGAACDDEELRVPLPGGYLLDADMASAKFSKRKRQLTICSENATKSTSITGPSSAASNCGYIEESPRALPHSARPDSSHIEVDVAPQTQAATRLAQKSIPSPANEGGDDDDDDDLPPTLTASRSSAPKAPAVQPTIIDLERTLADGHGETNEVAEALMKKALDVKERKRRETDEARKAASLSAGGLKKGFLSRGTASKKPASTVDAGKPSKCKDGDVPFITGAANPEEAKMQSLQLPEVQNALRQGTQKLKEDQSWITPQLMGAMQARPDLMGAMQNPKVQEAMALMQTDPTEAKKKYANDPEVTKFFKEFSGLMATHFDVLSQGAAKNDASSKTSSAVSPAMQQPVTPTLATDDLPQLRDPKVMEAFADPEVQSLINAVRQGHPLEMHELSYRKPRLFEKVKILLDAGLLGVAR